MADQTTQLRNFVNAMIRPIRDRIMMLVARGVLDTLKDDEGLQSIKLKLLAGEVREEMERFQDAGFTSTPLPGAEAVAIFPGGNREHGLILAISDRRTRPKDIPEGGAAIYSFDDEEVIQILKILPDGTIEIGKDTLEKILNGESFQTLYNAHTHVGNLGVPTTAPVVPSTAAELSSVVSAAT